VTGARGEMFMMIAAVSESDDPAGESGPTWKSPSDSAPSGLLARPGPPPALAQRCKAVPKFAKQRVLSAPALGPSETP
jgi:hypothetical protein